MANVVKLKAHGAYNGHSFKANKSVDLSIKFAYSELTNYIKLIQLLNENVTIVAKKLAEETANKLGTFMIKEIKVDGDGEGTIKFNSQLDYVEADTINNLVGEEFDILFKATIEDAVDEAGD